MEGKDQSHRIPDEILDLLARKALGQLPKSREQELADWLAAHPMLEDESVEFRSMIKKYRLLQRAGRFDPEAARLKFLAKLNSPPPKRKLYQYVLGYAAAILFFAALGWYLVNMVSRRQDRFTQETVIPERHNKAILILSNGEQLILDQPGKTVMEEEGNITIRNTPGEVLAYDRPGKPAAGKVMNSLLVPAGARYQVLLSDSTRVWVNSVSTLEYPVAFNGPERRVTLSGEAYFEVSTDPARPFVIETNGYEVRVLGTSFNVSSYGADAFMQTTLVAGSVEVGKRNGESMMLEPGQAITINNADQTSTVEAVDTRFFTSWKDGILHFNRVTLEELAVKLERWYDVEIQFTDPEARQLMYSGAMENSRDITFLLDLIEQTADVTFEVEGNRILVK